jgi:hypothetical protein
MISTLNFAKLPARLLRLLSSIQRRLRRFIIMLSRRDGDFPIARVNTPGDRAGSGNRCLKQQFHKFHVPPTLSRSGGNLKCLGIQMWGKSQMSGHPEGDPESSCSLLSIFSSRIRLRGSSPVRTAKSLLCSQP